MFTKVESKTFGLTVIRPYIFKDYRGEYTETYNAQEVLPGITFVQDSALLSSKGVVRGFHGDNRTTKLITCLHGTCQVVVMCIDPAETELYRKYETFILDDKERLSLVIPPKYVTAYQCLSDTSIYFYKQNTFYKGEKYQYTITLQAVDVIWPLPPILSYRDAHDGHFPLWYINIESEPRKLLAPEEVNK